MSTQGMRWSKLEKWVGVRISQAMHQSLEEQARKEGRAAVTLIRDAIAQYLAAHQALPAVTKAPAPKVVGQLTDPERQLVFTLSVTDQRSGDSDGR